MDNKIYGLIGICMKAGKVLSGSEQVESGIKKQKAFHLPYRIWGTKIELGQSLGKSIRTAVLITDKGLASALLKKLEPVL